MRLSGFNQTQNPGASIFAGQEAAAQKAPIKNGYRRNPKHQEVKAVQGQIIDLPAEAVNVIYQEAAGDWAPKKQPKQNPFTRPGSVDLSARPKQAFQGNIDAQVHDPKQDQIQALSERMDRLERMVQDNRDARNPEKPLPFIHAKQPQLNENQNFGSKLDTATIMSRRYAFARNQVSFA